MTFEWDEAKSDWTKEERGFNFAYASSVFSDEDRVHGAARTVKSEARELVIGKASFGDILFVVYTWRHYENETTCRILSARKASKNERRRYSRVR